MAPKNLLPVAALCSALASGTPLAAWATPATASSLPQALNPAANSSGIVACQRFSLAHATVRTSGCLHRNTVDSIVVDINRPDKENGPGQVAPSAHENRLQSTPMATHAT